MSEFDRRPDTIVFTYETTIDYVVDLRDGSVKRGEVGELADESHYVALFCEGEFAGEYQDGDQYENDDEELIDKAADLLSAAFESGTVIPEDSTEQPA